LSCAIQTFIIETDGLLVFPLEGRPMPLGFLATFWQRHRKSRRIRRFHSGRHYPVLEALEDRLVPSLSGLLRRLPVLPTNPRQPSQPNAGAYVTGLYLDLLHRQASPQEIASWNAGFAAGLTRAQIATDFVNSPEYRTDEILSLYGRLLGRVPGAGEISAWLGAMNTGMGVQQLTTEFIASDEYYSRWGANVATWLNGLYHDVLGRLPDAAGQASWVSFLQQGGSRLGVAAGFVYSLEGSGRLAVSAFHNVVSRDPNASEMTTWANALQKGTPVEQLTVALASSQEYVYLTLGAGFSQGTGPGGNGPVPFMNGPGGPTQIPATGSQSSNSTGLVKSAVSAATGISLSVGPNIDVNKEIGNQSEAFVAVNPRNPAQVFVVSNEVDLPPGSGMMASFSADGGVTWNPRLIGDGTDGLPVAFSDPWAAWDEFGNLFFSYLGQPFAPNFTLPLTIAMSTDGGRTFTKQAQFTNVFDHPEITVGNGSVFVTYATATATGIAIAVQGAQVTGTGQVGQFNSFLVPGSDNENFGDVAVGPNGEVMVAMQSSLVSTGSGPDNILVSTNLAPFSGGVFSNVRFGDAAHINVGNNRFVPPSPHRGVTANIGLAWDRSNGPHRGRAYLIYSDAFDDATPTLNVFLRHSDDGGKTWSAPVRVDDDPTNRTKFFPKMAVDQSTGILAIAWYDARNDATDLRTDIFTTVSLDGGLSFLPNVKVTTGQSNVQVLPGNGANDYGDYIGLSFANNQYHVAWADNSRTLQGNPEVPSSALFPTSEDIATATITLVGLPGSGPIDLPNDPFDPNGSPFAAANLGVLSSSAQTIANLTINRANNQDWFIWTPDHFGTLHLSITYNSPVGGDLFLRVFTLTGANTFIELGSSRLVGTTSQSVSVPVGLNEPLFILVYGFDGAIATYNMTGVVF
jgi:hypothetical protein